MKNSKAAKSLLVLSTGTLLTAILNFSSQYMIARHMTLEDFGKFSSAFYLAMTLAPLCGFGIPQLWLKSFGSEGWQGIRFIIPGLKFTSITTAIVWVVLIVWFEITTDYNDKWLVFLSVIVVAQVVVEILSAVFQLEERYSSVALIQSSIYVLRFIFLVILYFKSANFTINSIAITYGLISLIIILASYKVLVRVIKHEVKLKGHVKTAKVKLSRVSSFEMISEAAIFGLSGVFYMIYYQLNIVLVKYFISDEVAGYYSVAFLFVSAAIMFPTIIYQKYLLPKLHRWAYHDLQKLKYIFKYGNIVMLSFGLIIVLIVWFASPYIITILFGLKYNGSIPLIQFLSLSIPLIYLASNAGAILVTKDNMRAKVKIMFLSSILSVLCFFSCYQTYGVYAGVISTFISNLLICVAYNYKCISFFRNAK
ncbi:oligosaccharide flippase family protein [Siccibacter colletis]|uniref:oligosaccharide flippase family protein n=1 Tax=Siccibacter colletis TaxID=1505757 RepID=UPI0028BF04E7|nr:oligosaccharide flippase family protein [Siccibacter colletis]WNN47302.1 oligosaccharide flippase family protein [Siccibacter colletis]